jgi:hypothetical protein
MVLPQVPDLHPLEVAWLAQGAHYVFADRAVQLLTPLLIAIRMLLIFLLRWHRFFQTVVGKFKVASHVPEKQVGPLPLPGYTAGLH